MHTLILHTIVLDTIAWTWLNWPAWTCLNWPDWTVLLPGLFMHVGTDCSWLDERTDLNNVVGTVMINQQPCSYMIEHVVKEWWNNKIEQRCYNKSTMNLVVVSSQVLHILTHSNNPCQFPCCNNMLKHDWTILLFHQSCSIMLTALLQGWWVNNTVIACDIFMRVG